VNAHLKKPFVALIAASAVSITLAGCSSDQSTNSSSASSAASKGFGDCEVTDKKSTQTLDSPKKKGVLTVGTVLPATGAYNGDTPDTVVSGYNYCMVAEIASRLGLSGVSIQNLSFDALVAGVDDSFDLASLDISITEAREKVVDFSDPYLDVQTGVLVPADSDWTESSLKSDAKVGVLTGSKQSTWVNDGGGFKKTASQFPSIVDLMASLKAGQIDAVLIDTPIELTEAANSKGTLDVIAQFDDGSPVGMVMPKGSKAKDPVNAVLADMKSDGTLDAIQDKWLWSEIDPTSLPTWK